MAAHGALEIPPRAHDGAVGSDDRCGGVTATQPAREFATGSAIWKTAPRSSSERRWNAWGRRGSRGQIRCRGPCRGVPVGHHRIRAQRSGQLPGARPCDERGSVQRRCLLSMSLSRNPGTSCSRGTTSRRMRLPTSPPAVIAQPMPRASPDHEARMRLSLLFIGVEDGGGEPASSTPASFHARFIASRSPAPMPCPMNGGVRWAASPSRKTLPRRQRSATWARKVYSATRTSSRSACGTSLTHGAMSGRSASRCGEIVCGLDGQHLEFPAVTGVADAHVRRGAVGSQTWCTPSH